MDRWALMNEETYLRCWNESRQSQLGSILLLGEYHQFLTKNYEHMNLYYEQAIREHPDDPIAFYALGYYHKSVTQNYAEMVRYYQLAIDRGSAEAAQSLARYHQKVTHDYSSMIQYYQLSLRQGNATAAIHLGNYYREQGKMQKMKSHYQKAASLGNSTGWYKLAMYYLEKPEKFLRYHHLGSQAGNIFCSTELMFYYQAHPSLEGLRFAAETQNPELITSLGQSLRPLSGQVQHFLLRIPSALLDRSLREIKQTHLADLYLRLTSTLLTYFQPPFSVRDINQMIFSYLQ